MCDTISIGDIMKEVKIQKNIFKDNSLTEKGKMLSNPESELIYYYALVNALREGPISIIDEKGHEYVKKPNRK